MRAAVLATTILVLGGSTAEAFAPRPPVPIAAVEITGAPSDAVAAALTTAIRIGAGERNPNPKAPPLPSCITPACVADAAPVKAGQAALVVAVTVGGEFHDQFALTVMLTGADGRILRRRAGECATCAVDEVSERLTALVAEIVAAPNADTVAVEITTSPVAVAVTVDGVDRGRAPFTGSLPAGPHEVVAGGITKPFFVEATGQPQHLDVALPIAASTRFRFGVITYGTAAVGVGALVVGGVLIAKDGDPSCAHPSCPEVYDTGTTGWLFAGLGVVALGGAAYMYWHDHRATRPVIAVVPTSGGAAAFATGRF